MIAYDFITVDNVSDFTFLSNIELAKKTLKEKNNLSEDSIYPLRDRHPIEYSVEKIEYIGRLIEFEIKSETGIIGYLHCFKSDGNDCLGIFTWQ